MPRLATVSPTVEYGEAHGDRGRRQAEEESHPRDRAGPVAAVGRGTCRAHRADDIRDRAAAGGHDQEARLKGRGEQFFQNIASSSRPSEARAGTQTTDVRVARNWGNSGYSNMQRWLGSPLSR